MGLKCQGFDQTYATLTLCQFSNITKCKASRADGGSIEKLGHPRIAYSIHIRPTPKLFCVGRLFFTKRAAQQFDNGSIDISMVRNNSINRRYNRHFKAIRLSNLTHSGD